MNGSASDNFDWDALAPHGLAGVIDPADPEGVKNGLIDRVQKHAIAKRGGSVEGKRVLDFGCGNGRLADWLTQRGAIVHGVDTSKEMIAEARKRAPRASFDVLDPDRLDLGPEPYDLTLSVGVLCFLPEEQLVRSLSAMRDTLSEGGRMVMIEKVSDGTPGRGWTLAHYHGCLAQAKLSLRHVDAIRLGFSRALGLTARRAFLTRLPLLPDVLALEARRNVAKGFAGGQYADYLFLAEPALESAAAV